VAGKVLSWVFPPPILFLTNVHNSFLQELKAFEIDLLGELGWNMYVSPEEYESFAFEVLEKNNKYSRVGRVDALEAPQDPMLAASALSAASTPWGSASFDTISFDTSYRYMITESVVLPYGQQGQDEGCWEGAPLLFQ
jgi:hypothetical protein